MVRTYQVKTRTVVGRGSAWRAASAALLFLLVVSAAAAASATLAWNPVSQAAGYRLYMGGASRSYTNSTDVGAQTSCVVSNLVEGSTYYFAVTDYNARGLESPYSNEVVYWVGPRAPQLKLGEVLVRQPVVFWGTTDLLHWAPVSSSVAWMVRPATNQAEFYRGQFLPLNIGREP